MSIAMVVMEEMAHHAVCMVCCKDLCNFNSGTIQTVIIIPPACSLAAKQT
jgi:hypothetical protein